VSRFAAMILSDQPEAEEDQAGQAEAPQGNKPGPGKTSKPTADTVTISRAEFESLQKEMYTFYSYN